MKKLLSIAILALMSAGTGYAAHDGLQTLQELEADDIRDLQGFGVIPMDAPAVPAPGAACEASAILAIQTIAKGMGGYIHTTNSGVQSIAVLANSCNTSSVRVAAVQGCSRGIMISEKEWITSAEIVIPTAKAMEPLCGSDRVCVTAALKGFGCFNAECTLPEHS